MDSVFNAVRKTVSKKKRRHIDGDYDLDLTYIKQNLIAMGFPAEKLEGVYRNSMEDVVRFLEEKHKDHYKVYNLCSERKYDPAKFQYRVAHYPFDDHNPPRIELIQPFCEDVDSWLAKSAANVAVIHCKAGKGRTGVMICAYLLHRHVKDTAADALKFYDETRTSDHKGVTIPSQRRYVGYYEQIVKARSQPQPEKYREKMLFLKGIRFQTIPHHSNLTPQIVIWKCSSSNDSSTTKIYESLPISNANRCEHDMCLEFTEKIPISGDSLIAVFNKPLMRKERMFQFWFNTYFVTEMGSSYISRNGSVSTETSSRMLDDCKTNSTSADITKVRRTLSNQSESSSNRNIRAATSFTFDVRKCLVLQLNKQELDKANKDRSHKLFDPNFQVVCYFEKEAKVGETVAAGASTGAAAALADIDSSLSAVAEEELDDNLSDTDTDTDDDNR